MALIECYECGKEISDKAPTCPNCGAPQRLSSSNKFLNNFANLKVTIKKNFRETISFKKNKYSKIFLILFASTAFPVTIISGVRLNQSGWNLDAVAWRLQNSKFIEQKCKVNGAKSKKVRNKCRSMIYKLGANATNITGTTYSYCNRKLIKDLEKNPARRINYDKCVEQKIRQDEYKQRIYQRRAEQSRIDEKKRKTRNKKLQKSLEIILKELNRPAPPPPKIHIIQPPARNYPKQINCQQWWAGGQLNTNCNQY